VVIRKRNILTLVLLSGMLALSSVSAQQHYPQGGVFSPAGRPIAQEGVGGQDLDTAVARIRKQTGGRVLAAETRFIDGRPVHVIRILTPQGKVRNYQIDARTGRQLQ
jgi:hypothetical protein